MGKKNQKEKIEKINNTEEEKLKLLNKVEYTDKEIIYRALRKNKSNLKQLIFEFCFSSLHKTILLNLPISKENNIEKTKLKYKDVVIKK